jgi:Icc-related predicted phosphoesterase
VKILALSDEVVEFIYSPQITDYFPDVDFVVGCGDLPFFYLEFIVTMLNRPLYYVHGNHDKPSQYLSDGRVVDRAEGCEALENLSVRVPARHGQVLVAGLGGSLVYNYGPHQYSQTEMSRRVLQLTPALLVNRARYGRFLDILITHAPPRGIHDAPDVAHTGFDAFLRLMDRFRPRYLLHGHSHVYRNDTPTITRYGRTQVINVYPYRVIEFGRHDV